MGILLRLTTKAMHANKTRGFNITLDGVDLISSFFLYSVGNRRRCGRTIHRENSGIFGGT